MESYQKECSKQEQKIARLRAEGADPHDVKKQVPRLVRHASELFVGRSARGLCVRHGTFFPPLIPPASQMIPDSRKRLAATVADLEQALVRLWRTISSHFILARQKDFQGTLGSSPEWQEGSTTLALAKAA